MATSTVVGNCPVCAKRTLALHCPSSTCTWHKCRNKSCDAVLDLRRRRGYRPEGDKYIPVRLGS